MHSSFGITNFLRKLLGILLLSLLFVNPAHSKVGEGDIQISPEVLKHFIKYLRNEYAKTFVLSKDGKFATYSICGAKTCSGKSIFKACKKETGNKCYIFAQRKKQKKIIRWNKADYIFPSENWNYNEMVKSEFLKGSNSGIKKEISDNDIIDILNNFGFISENLALKQTKTETTQTQQVAKKESKKEDEPITDKDLEGLEPSKSRMEEVLEFFAEAIENKAPIDPDVSVLQFGYEDFEEFAKEYLKIFELTDISINEIREFLAGTDETVIIDQSQENLDKLYSLIINDKYLKKKTGYFKKFKKGKHKGNQINRMNLAVYINYEKEMAKITKNPNLEKVSRFAFWFSYAWGSGSYNIRGSAISGCEKDAKKYKLVGGKCIIVDWRNPITGEIKNMLKPDLELAKKMDILKKQKSIPKKKKKKVIAKKKEKIKETTAPVDFIIPVQVYIIEVNKPNYKTNITQDDVKNDFKFANTLWNTKGIQFKVIHIAKVKGNSKSIKKDLKWVNTKFMKSLQIDTKNQKVKSNNMEKYTKILFKLIGAKKNRNKNAINVFYIPYLPNKMQCGVAYSYANVESSHSEVNKLRRQNWGFAIIGEESDCKGNRGLTVAHELGHMFSLGHKEKPSVDLMMWGGGTDIKNWQVDKLKKYHKKYLKNKLVLQ
jgi:hypothetical protein